MNIMSRIKKMFSSDNSLEKLKKNLSIIIGIIENKYYEITKETNDFDNILIIKSEISNEYDGDTSDINFLIKILEKLGYIELQTNNNFSIYTPRFFDIDIDDLYDMYLKETESEKSN